MVLSRWSRWWVAGLAILLAGPAWAQTKETEPASAVQPAQPQPIPPAVGPDSAGAATAPPGSEPPSPDRYSPARLMDGPSLRETGRIAVAPAPVPMNLIEREGQLASPNEKSIVPAAATIGTPLVPRQSGVIPPRVLQREISERFTGISGCRIEVARSRQVTPPQIVADKLLLRWIIESDGTIGPTDVVAVAPIDLAVMDCAKRVMSQWKFTPPRGGQVAVERPFAF
jgi:hypothetical protein